MNAEELAAMLDHVSRTVISVLIGFLLGYHIGAPGEDPHADLVGYALLGLRRKRSC